MLPETQRALIGCRLSQKLGCSFRTRLLVNSASIFSCAKTGPMRRVKVVHKVMHAPPASVQLQEDNDVKRERSKGEWKREG